MTTPFFRLASTIALLGFIAVQSAEAVGVTYDLRIAGGGKGAVVQNVGDIVNLELWAVVTGTNSSLAEGFQYGYGSLLSSVSSGSEIRGDLTATVVGPFADGAYQNGAMSDLDGDGVVGQSDLDVGSNNNKSDTSFLFANKSGSVQVTPSAGGGPGEFKLATVTFQVTGITLAMGSQTVLNFRPAVFPGINGFSAAWQQDGVGYTSRTAGASISPGVPVTISSIPEPSSLLLLGVGALGCCSLRRRRR